MSTRQTNLLRILLCLLGCALASRIAEARTIEFETTQVTQADVALSPDGQWLIFTMLGHLFRLPVEGGTAEQLTFGPYYDSDPVFSPDGARVAFVSDRDDGEDNVFVLELATSRITQVTRESHAQRIRLTWTPDGQAIVYLPFTRALYGSRDLSPALLRRVSLDGGEPETLIAPARLFRSVFYLPDGRLAWTVVEREGPSSTHTTRIEVISPEGVVSTVRTMSGYADRAVPSPAGDGLYWRHRHPGLSGGTASEAKNLLFVPLPGGALRQITLLSHRTYVNEPQFAVAADNQSLYLGQDGRLWKIALASGARDHLAFRARVRLEIQAPTPPPTWAPAALGSSAPPRSVLWPRLSPDGRSLVFGAAGYLWQQPLGGGQAQRLFEGSALEYGPAFSPDGRQLAFVRYEYGKDREIKVFDFETRQTRTLASGDLDRGYWSRDGERLVFAEWEGDTRRVVAVNLSDGKKETFAEVHRSARRPHFSADGQSLYFTVNGTVYRLPLKEGAKPEAITQLERHLINALVSPDGKWLALLRNTEIWLEPLGKEPVTEVQIRQLSPEGGFSFAFMPDSSALIYAAGNRVWQHSIAGGEREEIPIRLELPRPTPPPVLVRRVRVLDFASGGFGPETSLFIEQGRIRWMGSERGRQLPPETVTLDAGGRFAIPGLFDLHIHTFGAPANQEAYLAYGVTSVRDVGARLTWLNALADRGEATSEPVPRYFFSGDFFTGAMPRPSALDMVLHDEDEARTYVRRWKGWGAHFIKIHTPISWPLQRPVAEEARRLGLPVVGHGSSVEQITKSVTLGYASLEHTSIPQAPSDDVLQMLALAGTRWDPTLTVRGGNALLLRDEPERLADPKLRAFAPEWRIRAASSSNVAEGLRGYWVKQLASIGAAHRRGVKLLTGTDAVVGSILKGTSLHWELEYFVQAGIPPLEVLRIATQEGAAAVGAEDHLGTLEVGKLADIVLLDDNPLEDIKNTQTIWRVIKGGWLYDPDKLRPPESVKKKE